MILLLSNWLTSVCKFLIHIFIDQSYEYRMADLTAADISIPYSVRLTRYVLVTPKSHTLRQPSHQMSYLVRFSIQKY